MKKYRKTLIAATILSLTMFLPAAFRGSSEPWGMVKAMLMAFGVAALVFYPALLLIQKIYSSISAEKKGLRAAYLAVSGIVVAVALATLLAGSFIATMFSGSTYDRRNYRHYMNRHVTEWSMPGKLDELTGMDFPDYRLEAGGYDWFNDGVVAGAYSITSCLLFDPPIPEELLDAIVLDTARSSCADIRHYKGWEKDALDRLVYEHNELLPNNGGMQYRLTVSPQRDTIYVNENYSSH